MIFFSRSKSFFNNASELKMFVSIQINDKFFKINAENPLDISIPLRFNGEQPNAFGVEKATSKPCRAGGLTGDTRRGGSCNFEQIKLIPHCNGTHTECVGHITHERISIRDCLKDVLFPALLISVKPENVNKTRETYAVELNENDKLITQNTIEKALQKKSKIQIPNPESLIVRTLPNDESKLARTYLKDIPPFFSTEAMKFITELKIKHLLVDLPSIDRIFDDGRLSNHRIFWNVEQGAFEKNKKGSIKHTITELIFAPDEIEDGNYLLNLQIAPFALDASPSRPILFEILESN